MNLFCSKSTTRKYTKWKNVSLTRKLLIIITEYQLKTATNTKYQFAHNFRIVLKDTGHACKEHNKNLFAFWFNNHMHYYCMHISFRYLSSLPYLLGQIILLL